MKFKSCFIFKATCIYIVKTHADNFVHFSKEMIHIETKKKKEKCATITIVWVNGNSAGKNIRLSDYLNQI